jgi:oligopeptide transport system substrate-binding protein
MTKPTYLLILILALSSCSSGEKQQRHENAGGVFRMALDVEPSIFIPRKITDFYSATLLNQVMEGLVSLDPEDLSVKPQIAESWKISNNGLKYEFKIRENVLFHPHPAFKNNEDRILTIEDVIHSIEIACRKTEEGLPTPAYNAVYESTILGLEDFHSGAKNKIAGISTNGNTLIIELAQQDANFIDKLSNTTAFITSKKVYEAKGEDKVIGTGPFVFSQVLNEERNTYVLKRNVDYYMKDKDGNVLPHLDEIHFIVETKKLDQLEMFENNETDFIVTLPSSRIAAMLEGRIKDFNSIPPLLVLRNNPLLGTSYYFFNMTDPRFQDVRVRKAFNYAVNREKITRDILRGQSYENGIYGIVPPISSSFKGYDFKGVRQQSYDYDPEKAKKLIAEAGYPEGKGFGSVVLRVNIGDIHSAVAEEFANQIYQTLGINVNIDGSSFEQKTKDADFLKGDLFRTSWFADYSSPETFLLNFYGKLVPESMSEASQTNQARYVNPKFDDLFEKAKSERKIADQYKYFAEAEKELLSNPPFIVLWYSGDIQLSYSKLRNFKDNPMNLFIFKEVYFKDWTKEEYEKNKLRN